MGLIGKLMKLGITSKGNVNEMKALRFGHKTYTASGAIDQQYSWIKLNNTTKIEMTIDAPEPGHWLIITQIDAGTAGHTVTLTAGTYDGSSTVATLNAQNETLVLFGLSATRFIVVENIGSVGLA